MNENTKMPEYLVRCSMCGTVVPVPFEPIPNRPLLCFECFVKRQNELHQNKDGAQSTDSQFEEN